MAVVSLFRITVSQNGSPHAGINLIDKLLSREGPLAHELHLLKSLELVHLHDLDSARESIETYKKLTSQSIVHPLFLVTTELKKGLLYLF